MSLVSFEFEEVDPLVNEHLAFEYTCMIVVKNQGVVIVDDEPSSTRLRREKLIQLSCILRCYTVDIVSLICVAFELSLKYLTLGIVS